MGHLGKESRPKVFPIREIDQEFNGEPARHEGKCLERTQSKGSSIVKDGTKKGYAELHNGDSIDFGFLNSKTRMGRVGKRS